MSLFCTQSWTETLYLVSYEDVSWEWAVGGEHVKDGNGIDWPSHLPCPMPVDVALSFLPLVPVLGLIALLCVALSPSVSVCSMLPTM